MKRLDRQQTRREVPFIICAAREALKKTKRQLADRKTTTVLLLQLLFAVKTRRHYPTDGLSR